MSRENPLKRRNCSRIVGRASRSKLRHPAAIPLCKMCQSWKGQEKPNISRYKIESWFLGNYLWAKPPINSLVRAAKSMIRSCNVGRNMIEHWENLAEPTKSVQPEDEAEERFWCRGLWAQLPVSRKGSNARIWQMRYLLRSPYAPVV